MLSLLILALFVSWQNAPAEKCSLSGTVVNSITGEALNKVDLRLEPAVGRSASTAVTKSDAAGRFELTNLEPGSYHLSGTRSGYLEMSFGARRPRSDGSLVRLEQGQSLNGLIFKLTPSAVIAGTIRDSDGEPLENAHVILGRISSAYGAAGIQSDDSVDTDDRGEYRFRGLPAGKYYVGVELRSPGWNRVDHSAKAGPVEIGVPTFYPGVTDISVASPIGVNAGGAVTNIDLTLVRSRVFRVSGRVTNMPAVGSVTVLLQDSKNATMRDYKVRTSTRNEAGDFEFRDVPPGAYDVTVGEQSLRGKTSILVGAADLEGIRVALQPGAEIGFRVTKEGSDKPVSSGLAIFLGVSGRNGIFGPGSFDTGNATVRNVAPDHYALRIGGTLLREFYVKSARAGDTDVLADGLTVAGPGTIDIDIVMGADACALQGIVRDKDGQAAAGATVLLAPDKRTRADLFKSATSDRNGHYEFAVIAPGNYKLFAWEDVEPDAWNDPDFLKDYEKQADKIALEPAARIAVELHAIR